MGVLRLAGLRAVRRFEADTAGHDFAECAATIAGRRVRIMTSWAYGEYYAAAAWEDFPGPGSERLWLQARSPDRAGQEEALAIFRTVRAAP